MNYPTFLKKVDSVAGRCEIEALRSFVHEVARTLSEDKRDRFLSVLESYSSPEEAKGSKKKKDISITEEIDDVLEKLDEIQNGERYIYSEYNEEWDDWDGEWEDEYNFSDPEDVIDDVGDAILLLHKAIDREEYKKGFELAEKLSKLNIPVSGDYDDSHMVICNLISRNLIDVDMKMILNESLNLAYMGNEEERRAEEMVRIMENYKNYSITLEEILESACDEIDLKSFIPSWIKALATRPSKDVDDLLAEALGMLDDTEDILNTASKYAASHPILYLSIMRSGFMDTSDMLDIGLRAVKEVPVNSDKRSEICLLTAGYALKAGNREETERCWLQAFISTPSVVNFLRIRLLCEKWEDDRDKMMRVAGSYYRSAFYWDKKPYAAILFFASHFDEMIEKFMDAGTGIGWSSTFMKEGIALFLMLLSCKAEGRGMTEMRKIAFKATSFSASEYSLGTDIDCHGSDYDMFIECFDKWKKDVSPDESQCELWIERIEAWIKLRVDAIMLANRRKYYGECAAFIAALGEVEESRGITGAKQRLMSDYRFLYSCRHAFISELVSYGMRK